MLDFLIALDLENTEQIHDWKDEEHTIETIQNPSMTWQNIA